MAFREKDVEIREDLDEILRELLERLSAKGFVIIRVSSLKGGAKSFLELLQAAKIVDIGGNIVWINERGREILEAGRKEERGELILKFLSEVQNVSQLLNKLERGESLNLNYLSSLERMALYLLRSYGYVSIEGSTATYNKSAGKRISLHDLTEDLQGYLNFLKSPQYEEMRKRVDDLLKLIKELKRSLNDDRSFKRLLKKLFRNSLSLEGLTDDISKKLLEDLLKRSEPLRRTLVKLVRDWYKVNRREKAASLLQLMQGLLSPLATELLTLLDPFMFSIYDERVNRLLTGDGRLEFKIFNRQAPEVYDLPTDYYVEYCKYTVRLRRRLEEVVGRRLDNLEVYIFLRFLSDSEWEGAPSEAVWSEAVCTEEVLRRLQVSYEVYRERGSRPKLSNKRFLDVFPWAPKNLLESYLYEHQLEAHEALDRGENLILISGTGSGKTEAWAFHALSRGKRVLALYPTLALSDDQLKRLRSYFGDDKVLKVESGVVSSLRGAKGRRILRKRVMLSQVVVTNPAFLMADVKRIPAGLSYLADFLEEVDLIVIDELDYYGSHGASLLVGVLSFLIEVLNVNPQIVVLTATLGNPEELAGALTRVNERETSVVRGNPFKAENVTFLIKDKRSEVKLPELLAELVRDDGVTLVFTRTVDEADRLAAKVRERLPKRLVKLVESHHHLVPRAKRRDIEKRARKGEVKVIITPRTLIQGIDIGTVKRAVHYGLPFDVREFKQREGRKGRREGMVSETVIVPISKWDYELLGSKDLLRRWMGLPNESVLVNPGNKYVKLFSALFKLKSPKHFLKLSDEEIKLLKELELVEEVDKERVPDVNDRGEKVWRSLNFFNYGPPYGYRRQDVYGNLLSEEELALSDVVEKFQPGCIDRSTYMIVVDWRIKERTVLEAPPDRLWSPVKKEVDKAVEKYERFKLSLKEKPNFRKDFYSGKVTSYVSLKVVPPKGFGLLQKIPTEVRWVVEGDTPVQAAKDGVVKFVYPVKSIKLNVPVKSKGLIYTYAKVVQLPPSYDEMKVRAGMAYLLSLMKLGLNLSAHLIRYNTAFSGTSGQLILWEPNPVGILEMIGLWRRLEGIVREHEPDELTFMYMWAVDKEAAHYASKFSKEELKEVALSILRFWLPGRSCECTGAAVAFDIIDLSPIVEEEMQAVVYDGEELDYFRLPLIYKDLPDEEVARVRALFQLLKRYVRRGYVIVHFDKGVLLERISELSGPLSKFEYYKWVSEGKVIDLHGELENHKGCLAWEEVEGLLREGRRKALFEDLLRARFEEGEVDEMIREYMEDNVKALLRLYSSELRGENI